MLSADVHHEDHEDEENELRRFKGRERMGAAPMSEGAAGQVFAEGNTPG